MMKCILNSFVGISLASTVIEMPERKHTPSILNSNHIFNTIHSSMRQWGSSLNHNGMSFFIATVPADTQFYHGSSSANRVNGTEWLAFEPEHALAFAHAPIRSPADDGSSNSPRPSRHECDRRKNDGSDEARRSHESFDRHSKYMPWRHGNRDQRSKDSRSGKYMRRSLGLRRFAQLPVQQPLLEAQDDTLHTIDSYGYLHTYRTRHDLRFLYIDGQSAAKSLIGTLDSQDIVLLHDNPPPSWGDHRHPPPHGSTNFDKIRPGGPMGESFRALHLCELASKEWQGRVDGFIRMELGFEIILCSFEKDLRVERITQAQETATGWPPGHSSAEQFAYYEAVASRFDGIGGNRVQLNYDFFVSMFSAPHVVYFDDSGLPRVRNKTKTIRPVQNAIREMVLQEQSNRSVDWQAITDLLIARYADRIEYLASGDLTNLTVLKAEADLYLSPFIDYSHRNQSIEIERCVSQYLDQPSSSSNTAAAAIADVTRAICSTLSDVGSATSLLQAIEMIQSLKSWLSWTSWKRCRGCDYHQVCFLPIWPMGGAAEHEHPKCISDMSEISGGYWGGFGAPSP